MGPLDRAARELGLGGITLVRISVVDPATGALIPVASYARSGTASAPTTLAVTGDPTVVARLVEVLAPVDPDFAIVTP